MCMAHAKAVNIDSSGNYTSSEDLDMHIMHVYTHLQQYQLTTISKLRVYML